MKDTDSGELFKNYRQQYDLLMESCRHISSTEDKNSIRQAFEEVRTTLLENRDERNEEAILHSISVARIVAEEMEMDTTGILSALLLDISYDKPEVIDSLKNQYGKKVVDILINLKRIADLRMDKVSINSENFIQLLLTMAVDVRVILIRLADRLNLMRIIDKLPNESQQQISIETSNLYSPLAHRLGLYRIKTELEELAMQHAYPEVFTGISRKIEDSRDEQNSYFKKFIRPIDKELAGHGLDYELKFRIKSIPSIWNKMKKQHIEFEQVYDYFAIRIILKSPFDSEKDDCWKAYSLITNIYPPNPSRLRDWISAPKPNGYESLHTTVQGPLGRSVEVQIRTKRMDEAAEKGRAAHWKYKEGPANQAETADQWLASIRSMLENYSPGQDEMSAGTKMELFSDYVFAFTPTGDLKKLKAGATVLDFAFDIHTDVGQKCSGAKVNNNYVPLKHILHTGDQVEIITTKSQKPNKDWLTYVTTSKAISKIKRCLKEAEYSQADRGKGMLQRKISQLKMNYSDEIANKLVNVYKAASTLDLFHGIAEGKYDLIKIKEFLLPVAKADESKLPDKPFTKDILVPAKKEHPVKALVIINEDTPLDDVKLARCCQPVLGDEIFGFVTVAEGIKIHRTSCTNALDMHLRYSYRIVKARWAEKTEISAYVTTITITGDDQLGMLNQISDTLTHELKANIRSINLSSANGKFEGNISINVDGKSHLDLIIARLSKLKGIKKVIREK
ncbi:MAG: bifunctional (p)ppGpp synthetase/guanosine-3',5'-bis(diphosphate) 3'-pyrophosphohydrolase [Bacteroidetes bacterium]|nr:bifunctional (p)ppGpp synthetase/guanosine-3',5'-bis(diphosphate) 3'-pyrophosphohydrolase [Bacteroidota bacterium]